MSTHATAGTDPAAGGPPSGDPAAAESGARRWAMLSLLSLAELLGMSLWFTASAVAPQLEARWALDAVQAGWLTTTVQLGFVAGTAFAAVLNLADILPARRYMALSALAGALANASLLVAPGFAAALVGRFFVGFFLAGVYPPAMKMIATWFRAARGMAIGTVVGALTVGKATPYLVSAFHTAGLGFVVLTGSAGAVVAALLVELGYRDGPFPFERRPFDWKLVGRVLAHRPSRLAIGGYLGHMWELYAMWALVSHFFLQYFIARGDAEAHALLLSGLVGFGAIAIGGAGSVIAGTWADHWGRERVASLRRRRLRTVQRTGHRSYAAPRRRDGLDPANVAGVRAHRAFHLAHRRGVQPGGVGARVQHAGSGAHAGDLGHGEALEGETCGCDAVLIRLYRDQPARVNPHDAVGTIALLTLLALCRPGSRPAEPEHSHRLDTHAVRRATQHVVVAHVIQVEAGRQVHGPKPCPRWVEHQPVSRLRGGWGEA
ncbi:MAG: MFS transporter [Gemmatimonadota bacterium]